MIFLINISPKVGSRLTLFTFSRFFFLILPLLEVASFLSSFFHPFFSDTIQIHTHSTDYFPQGLLLLNRLYFKNFTRFFLASLLESLRPVLETIHNSTLTETEWNFFQLISANRSHRTHSATHSKQSRTFECDADLTQERERVVWYGFPSINFKKFIQFFCFWKFWIFSKSNIWF